jgi:hypothetical protein
MYYIDTFGLLEGDDAGVITIQLNSTIILFIYLQARDVAQVKVHLYP